MSKKDGESVGSPVSQGHLSAIARLPQAVTPCDMCSNYEAQLVRAQQERRELEKQVATLERTVERYREDLTKEADFRKDMEEKWNEKKEEHKVQVMYCTFLFFFLEFSHCHRLPILVCPIRRPKHEWEGNITVLPREMYCKDVKWIHDSR